jgi:hypothetical protein
MTRRRGRARRKRVQHWIARAHRGTPKLQLLAGVGRLTAVAIIAPIAPTGPAGNWACVWHDPESGQSQWSFHQDRATAAGAAPPDAVAPFVVDRTVKSTRHPLDSAALDKLVAGLRKEQKEGMRRRLKAQQRAEAAELGAATYPGAEHTLNDL